MRIVTLLPSATEIVCELGLGTHLVGVSHECDYPDYVTKLPKVTSSVIPKNAPSGEIDRLVRDYLADNNALYLLDLELLESLRPDVIITQALCDVCAVSADDVDAAVCALPGSPTVVNLEPSSLADVFDTIRLVGEATNRIALAQQRIAALETRIESVAMRGRILNKPRVLLLEWLEPPFNAGHWSPELVELAGGEDCLGSAGQPSRTLSWPEIEAAKPDILFIACCGYSLGRTLEDIPGLRKQPTWSTLSCVRENRVYACDGNAYFSRPGPRLVDSLELLADVLHFDRDPRSAKRPDPVSVKRISCH